ncbi:MAG TPA: 2-oxoacid:acceptor oxidoreductase family protein [Methylomusa anaerophila]|uniref:Pyruvate synthase subunit PorC n=1 Tax=Methylomusa anaerophila TaxID=1930071 RepID=A0A348APS8_9FIRM|nr:2-oxoacid:acceptor oxidoreductase family protein [Methylomusa anaerophila]BBB93076.1 pyruvate synthase subunit PorC [Methylomusa anaerophila]HML87091.1 2-oxoacid:acceptor oxidoreductase family protein [Methylomusa anaerophila]
MIYEIIMAGFGGQGVMLMGQLLTYAGMLEDKKVSWIPSYGPEMRGGTANCSVIISDEPIGSPIVTEPTLVVAMNLPSMDKFESALQSGGVLIINSSLIEREVRRDDIKVFKVPANDIAAELGNIKTANMVIVGALIGATGIVAAEAVLKAFAKMFAKKPELLAINEQAIKRGMQFIQK